MSNATAQRPVNGKPAVETTAPPAEEFSLLDQAIEATTKRLEQISTAYDRQIMDSALPGAAASFRRAAVTAKAIELIRKEMKPEIVELLRSLMNSRLGFLTDRKDPKFLYDEETIKKCAIQAVLQGVRWTGNEFNIIAGECYITKEGYERKCNELSGLTNLRLMPGVPFKREDGQWCVRFGAKWNFKGEEMELRDAEGKPGIGIPLISHDKTSVDAMIGKATRKALYRIYKDCVGSERAGVDKDPDDVHIEPAGSPAEALNPPKPQADASSRDWIDREIAELGFPLDEAETYDIARRALEGKPVTNFADLSDQDVEIVMAVFRQAAAARKVEAAKSDAEKAIAKKGGGNKQGKFPNAGNGDS